MKKIETLKPLKAYEKARHKMVNAIEKVIDARGQLKAGSTEYRSLDLYAPVMLLVHFGGFDGLTTDVGVCKKHGQRAGVAMSVDTLMYTNIGYGASYFACNAKAFAKNSSDIVDLRDLHLTELAAVADALNASKP